MDNPDNKAYIDHIDRNKTNNRVSNLRWATPSENQCNMSKHSDGSSKYKGVSKQKNAKKWTAQIKDKDSGKVKHIGLFKNTEGGSKSI